MSPVARLQQRMPKDTLHIGNMLAVKVVHVEDPQEFYVIRVSCLASLYFGMELMFFLNFFQTLGRSRGRETKDVS